MLNLNQTKISSKCAQPVFNLAFRTFFLGAVALSVVAMTVWMLQISFHVAMSTAIVNPIYWHAHEMIFGYSLAVITGFTLTAVKNWTNIQTPYGCRLAWMFGLWLVARILLLIPHISIIWPMLFDLAFDLMVTYEFAKPVFKTRQWKQISLVSKVLMIGLFNLSFYLGILGVLDQGIQWGLLGGFFIALSLVITMARRIIGFFIEKGVGVPGFQVKNYRWVDLTGLGLFIAFSAVVVFIPNAHLLASVMALALFVIHLVRLWGWHHAQLWNKPLLSSLFAGYATIVFGFLLYAIAPYAGFSLSLAIHAFAIGAFGLIVFGMMARVSLGHTGRNVFAPPAYLNKLVWILIVTMILRVIFPMIDAPHYSLWILLSQLGWIMVFLTFLIGYFKVWTQPRVDGHFG